MVHVVGRRSDRQQTRGIQWRGPLNASRLPPVPFSLYNLSHLVTFIGIVDKDLSFNECNGHGGTRSGIGRVFKVFGCWFRLRWLLANW